MGGLHVILRNKKYTIQQQKEPEIQQCSVTAEGEKKDKTSTCFNVCMHTHKCADTQRGVISILTEAHTVNRARYNYTQ